ncbi:3'-5' exonuclease [Candidatus Giovannonibacteria bacterium]|nr:3'-5' exonuclease [Candidatus Giovannonibacteria bacterium]
MKGKEFETNESPISFIDLEMTGLEGSKHEIVEIGLVKVSQPKLEIIESWDVKVKPEKLENADPEALRISNYDADAWKSAVSLKEMMKMLSAKIQNTILAGWNISTDYAFLDAASTKTGVQLDFHKRVFDITSYAYSKLGYEWSELGLGGTAKKLGISNEKHHTALADAMACYEVYKKVRMISHETN